MTRYIMIENMPGYLPESDDPPTFDNYSDAMKALDKYWHELMNDNYDCGTIVNGQFTYYPEDASEHNLGRNVEIISAEEQDIGESQEDMGDG